MRLIVDTNRIIAALIKNSTSRKIIMSRKLELVTIGLSKLEIAKYRDEILKKSNLKVEELDKSSVIRTL
ncbi:MAG: hypothetical protein KGH61_01365 [Candidatus Micrarchaeota archaeon]|nr:hypothetical protein [Candidatus Micrarchaeota archaeon]MDE1847580.1 hypothetical protein [Candidatus Micrarchaeota archaeon]MDE1864812.1 hypothetical protein [Candidatus Micrarchaeota archaeon]